LIIGLQRAIFTFLFPRALEEGEIEDLNGIE
jgi:hypothetical protein